MLLYPIQSSPAYNQFLTKSGGKIYQWYFDNSSRENGTSPTTSHNYPYDPLNDTTINVHLIATSSDFNCTDTFYNKVVIFPSAKANYSLSKTALCSPDSIIFTNLSKNAFNSYWNFGDGTVKTLNNNKTVSHLYNIKGLVKIDQAELYIESNRGCSSIKDTNITVKPDIVPGFSADTIGCAPFTVQFTDLTIGSVKTYNWIFGDGNISTAKSPFYTYEDNDTTTKSYTAKLKVTSVDNCIDSVNHNILVYPTLIANFSIDTNQVCEPFIVNIKNKSLGACNVCYLWSFGDQVTSNTGKTTFPHTYPTDTNRSSYNLFLTVWNNSNKCKDTMSQIITVNPPLLSSFRIQDSVCSPYNAQFVNQSTGSGRKKYFWSFGDGYSSSLTDPLHTFTNSSSLELADTINLVTTSEFGCSKDTSQIITVFPAPVANFSIDPALQFFPNATFSFKDLTNKGPWKYLWNFGDGRDTNSIGSIIHTYQHWGLKDKDYKIPIKLLTSNGDCADSAFDTLILFAPKPIANFDSLTSGCTPITIKFKNESKWGESYIWDFDDQTISTDTNPTHTFSNPGEYNVKLTTNAEGGTDSHYELINVYPIPAISFMVEPKVVEIKQDVIKCYNNTQNATNYLWNFGDYQTSTDNSPTHTYNDTGKYIVSLIAWSYYGCCDTLIGDTVKAEEAAGQVKYPNAFMPGQPGIGGSANPNALFHPAITGDVAEYHFEIYNRWGERIYATNDVNQGWDGYYKGKLCEQDVYVYKAWGRFLTGRTFVKAGDITLLHKTN